MLIVHVSSLFKYLALASSGLALYNTRMKKLVVVA
jgi:hypothetical protein